MNKSPILLHKRRKKMVQPPPPPPPPPPLPSPPSQNTQSHRFVVDDLYCKEEDERNNNIGRNLLLDHDQFWEEIELHLLLSKEAQTHPDPTLNNCETDVSLTSARRNAVEWILKVGGQYSFSALTLVLSVSYLDQFLSTLQIQIDKPWMMQLIAVACLSLAAKLEETHVPLLLDLQAVEARYVFEPKSVQRMELLVLSTLKWKMYPVTPICFINHFIEKLDAKTCYQPELRILSEHVLLSVVTDSRFVCYRPSELAAAIMIYVINRTRANSQSVNYKKKLLSILKISTDRLEGCNQLIVRSSSDVQIQLCT